MPVPFIGQCFDLGRSAVHEHHADVERAQDRDVQEDIGEVFVGDNRAIHAQDERFFAELGNILQDAPQIGEFHARSAFRHCCHTKSLY
jgi:hypothetical protein